MSHLPSDVSESFAKHFVRLLADDECLRNELERLALLALVASQKSDPAEEEPIETGTIAGGTSPNATKSEFQPTEYGFQDRPSERERAQRVGEGQHFLNFPKLVAAFEGRTAEVPSLISRCRLKVEASRRASFKDETSATDQEGEKASLPSHEAIIQRAKESNCYLWMCDPLGPRPQSPEQYEQFALAYGVLADSASLLHRIVTDGETLGHFRSEAMLLVAEAQSALRVLLGTLDITNDIEQVSVHRWLRNLVDERGQFIDRYMMTNDPADPAQLSFLDERIRSLEQQFEETKKQESERRKLFSKVKHKAGQIVDGSGDDWPGLIAAVDQLVSDRVPASDKELRKCLLPIIESRPVSQEEPEGFLSVVSAIQEYVSQKSSAADLPDKEPIDDIQAVAERLGDSAVLLVGGACDHVSKRRIEQVFKLKTLIHIKTWTLRSPTDLQHVVARKDVSIVLLTSDCPCQFDSLNIDCEIFGKPLVRLGADLSPDQVARSILEQCGDGFDDGNESAG